MNSESSQLDLDRHHLHNVRNAFLALNRARLQVARDGLSDAQCLFLDVLPCLFHFNHPMLPGYNSRTTPAGVYGFSLSEEQATQLRKLAKSFRPNRSYHDFNQQQPADILALFSMGSLGTIAQNTKSDIDLWLCHRSDLNGEELKRLRQKSDLICAWAKTLRLEVTIFLMDHRSYQGNSHQAFGQEASGSTQHLLLLDEFYRTAIHLAGQLPLWLFVNAEQETQYQHYGNIIEQQRLLPDKRLIDFGRIQTIPASEFISSAIWQLYKAIDSPYKSILKLLLLEIYCKGNEQALLSDLFKQRLHEVDHRRMLNVWDADPYIKAYEFIEEYLLASGQTDRLEFLRRCFYFKLDQPLSGDSISPRSSVLLAMTREWQWSADHIEHLDKHHQWSLKQVLKERRLIIDELNHSYHFVMEYFRTQRGKLKASNRELNVLGRKLQAAFSRKAGKIDWVNPLLSNNLVEQTLIIKKEQKTNAWSALDRQGNSFITKSSPVELLTWLHCNQVMGSVTRLNMDRLGNASKLLNHLRQQLSEAIPLPIKSSGHKVFEEGCRLKKLVFFVDVFSESVSDLTPDDYSDPNINQYVTVECLTVNSWNEIVVENRQGPLLETLLIIYTELLQAEQGQCKPEILCVTPRLPLQKTLKKLTGKLFSRLSRFFYRFPHGRYLTRFDSRYLMIDLNKQNVNLKWFLSDIELKQTLAAPVNCCSPVTFDALTLGNHPLAMYADYYVPNGIQVFFRKRGQSADITLIDELGSWFETSIDYSYGVQSLQPLHRFLRAISERQYDKALSDVGPLDILPINFYEMFYSESGWIADLCSVSPRLLGEPTLSLFAIAEYRDGEYKFIVHCENKIYSEVEEGLDMYTTLAHTIKRKDTQSQSWPYCVTDMDLSRCRQYLSESSDLQTIHYLQIKTLVEMKINRALSIL